MSPNGNPGLEESTEKLAATRSACMEEVEGGQETDKQKMREKEREQSIYQCIYLKTKERSLLKLVNFFLYEISAAVQPSREIPQKV